VRLARFDHHPEGVIPSASSVSYDDTLKVWSEDLDAVIVQAS
jgi:hypothetical protein